jgi:uncharacterized protein
MLTGPATHEQTGNLTTVPRASRGANSPMKLHADTPHTLAITALGDGWIAVNGERRHTSVVLTAAGEQRDWPCRGVDELSEAHFESLIEGAPAGSLPELVLFGSGPQLRFVHPRLLRGLIQRGIGVETMDTAAACRTYNILAAEGRRVTAALLLQG